MKKIGTIILFTFIFIGFANGQISGNTNNPDSRTIDWRDKIFIGGNLGASFGTITNVNISPMIGFKFTPKTIAGVTLTYQYFKQTFSGGGEYKTNIYGAGLFARQYLLNESLGAIDNIFIHAEYEGLNFEAFNGIGQGSRDWLFTGLVGGGVQADFLTLTALYILNHDPNNSPYGAVPYVIRVGVGF